MTQKKTYKTYNTKNNVRKHLHGVNRKENCKRRQSLKLERTAQREEKAEMKTEMKNEHKDAQNANRKLEARKNRTNTWDIISTL